MNLHSERHLGFVLVALLGSAMAMPVLDWWHVANLPAASLDAIERQLPGGTAAWVETNRTGEGTIYDVHVRHQGSPCVVQVTPQGQVLQVTRTLRLPELPADVRDQVRSRFPKSFVRAATMVTDVQGRDRYEIAVATGQQLATVTLGKAHARTDAAADAVTTAVGG